MAKAKSVETSVDLLQLVEKSGLLAPESFAAAQAIAAGHDDPKAAAREWIKAGWLTTWQATQLLNGFAALRIGAYHLQDQIGKGELGRVYLAKHESTGQQVALKTLAGKNAADPQLAELFVAQAEAARGFEHRHVLRVLEVIRDEDRTYVVSEYLPGGDLQQRVEKSGPLPLAEAVEFVAQAADGMAYVHGRDSLHKNLTPAHLMVDEAGTLRILDVGGSEARGTEKPGGENTGELLLSALGFTSPEQIRAKEVDARTDIYALGGILYFLLTGRVPFTAKTNEERDLIRKTKRPIPLNTLEPAIPEPVALYCDQMMALKPSDRPASMSEVATQIRQLGGGSDSAGEIAFEETDLGEALAFEELAEDAGAPAVAASAAEDFSELSPEVSDEATLAAASGEVSFAELTDAPLEPIASADADISEPSVTPAFVTGPDSKVASGDAIKIMVEGAGPSGPAPAVGKLKIQKKKKAEITEAVAAAGEGEADEALAAITRKAKKQRMILFSTAGISVVIIILGIVVMMLPSDEATTQVAQATEGAEGQAAAADAGAATAVASPAMNPDDPENLPDPETIPNPAAPMAVAAPEVAATTPPPAADATAVSAPMPAPVTPAPGPAPTPPPVPAPGTLAATTPAAPAPAAPETTTPAPTAASTPAPAPTPAPAATEPAPAATAAVPAPAAEPKPAEPMPAPPMPTPPPAKPVSGPTFAIATSVDLPKLPAADGSAPAESLNKTLGQINIEPKASCFIALLGGDKASRSRTQFSIRNAQQGTAPRDWEFVEQQSGAEVVVAKLALPAQDLNFEWTPEGLKSPNAGSLQNCALKITAGQDKPHLVSLRTVILAPPIALENLEKSSTTRFALESAPDGSALRMEATMPDQKVVFEAGGDITKGDSWIYFGEAKEQAPLGLKLDTTVNPKGIQIAADTFFLAPGEKPQKLTPALRKRLNVGELQRQAAGLSMKLDAMKKLKKEDQQKLQNEFNLTNLARENLDKAVVHLQKFDETFQRVNGMGKVHLRIFYDAGEHQIDLVKTSDDAPPAK